MVKLILDDQEVDMHSLSEKCRNLTIQISHIDSRILECQNMQALLTKAKRAYISELKSEMLNAKTGFDFSDI